MRINVLSQRATRERATSSFTMILSAFLKSVVAGAGAGLAIFGLLDLTWSSFPGSLLSGVRPETLLNYAAVIGGVAGALIGVFKLRVG